MQASNSQWSQAQGQVGRVASGVELLGQGVRVNLTSMFERMSLSACGGAGHQASNPLQVQGQDRGHEDLWVSEVHNKWTKGIRFAMGVFKGNTMEDLEGLLVKRRVRNLWNKEFMAVQLTRVRAMAGAVGRILEELAVEDNRVLVCLVLWVKAKPTDLRVRQNVIMHGNMEVLVNMVMDKVSMPDRGVWG